MNITILARSPPAGFFLCPKSSNKQGEELLLINLQTMKGVNLCKKIEPLKTNSPRQYGAKRKLEIQPSPSIRFSWNKQKTVWFLK